MKEKGEHLVASKWRWDDRQRQRKSQEEQAWKENQGLEEEDERKWCAAFGTAARKMLKYLEDNEDLKAGLSELKEQLETLEEAGFSIMQIAKQARNERGQKLFETFRQRENEVYIASLAMWDTQLKRICGAGKALSGTDAGGGAVKRKTRSTGWHGGEQEGLEERSTPTVSRDGFREIQGVHRCKGQKKLWNSSKRSICSQSGKAKGKGARMLQRLGGSRAIKHWTDARDTMSVESYLSSLTCDMEEACFESSRKMQDMEGTTYENSWTAVTRGKEEEVWRLEPEGEA